MRNVAFMYYSAQIEKSFRSFKLNYMGLLKDKIALVTELVEVSEEVLLLFLQRMVVLLLSLITIIKKWQIL